MTSAARIGTVRRDLFRGGKSAAVCREEPGARRREPEAAHPLGGDPPDARGLLDAVPVRLVVLVVVGVVLALRHGCSAAGRERRLRRRAADWAASSLGRNPAAAHHPGHRMSIEAVRFCRVPEEGLAAPAPAGSETDIAAVGRRHLVGGAADHRPQPVFVGQPRHQARTCLCWIL